MTTGGCDSRWRVDKLGVKAGGGCLIELSSNPHHGEPSYAKTSINLGIFLKMGLEKPAYVIGFWKG